MPDRYVVFEWRFAVYFIGAVANDRESTDKNKSVALSAEYQSTTLEKQIGAVMGGHCWGKPPWRA